MSEICSVCKKECRGGFLVREGKPTGQWDFVVIVDTTPDRNFNVCDACNITICFDCSLDPDSGYCNACLGRLGHPSHG